MIYPRLVARVVVARIAFLAAALLFVQGCNQSVGVEVENHTTGKFYNTASTVYGHKKNSSSYLVSASIVEEDSLGDNEQDTFHQTLNDVFDEHPDQALEESEQIGMHRIETKKAASKPIPSRVVIAEQSELKATTEQRKPSIAIPNTTFTAVPPDTEYKKAVSDVYASSSDAKHNAALASFMLPAQGKILKKFGKTQSGFHDGVSIALKEGKDIVASQEGYIVYAGKELEEYGYLVIVEHQDDILTSYAHMNNIAVNIGQFVQKGEVIGNAGSTGNVKTPQLLFSVRVQGVAVDPMKYLKPQE